VVQIPLKYLPFLYQQVLLVLRDRLVLRVRLVQQDRPVQPDLRATMVQTEAQDQQDQQDPVGAQVLQDLRGPQQVSVHRRQALVL